MFVRLQIHIKEVLPGSECIGSVHLPEREARTHREGTSASMALSRGDTVWLLSVQGDRGPVKGAMKTFRMAATVVPFASMGFGGTTFLVTKAVASFLNVRSQPPLSTTRHPASFDLQIMTPYLASNSRTR